MFILTVDTIDWPPAYTKAKGQLLILDLIERACNRRRGIGFTFGGFTPSITKMATVKVTLELARRLILLLKKTGAA